MFRSAVRILIVVGLLGMGWAVGRAQAPVQAPSNSAASSDFELLVNLGNGTAEVTCVRGCKLTWAPKGEDMLAPDVKVRGRANPKYCMSPEWASDNCRILGWKR
jgi:hypothetical protein